MMVNFMENKNKNPKMIQKQISRQLKHPDSTIKRFSDDFQMDCLYYIKRHKNKSTTKIKTENPTPKKSKRSDLKGGSCLEHRGEKAN